MQCQCLSNRGLISVRRDYVIFSWKKKWRSWYQNDPKNQKQIHVGYMGTILSGTNKQGASGFLLFLVCLWHIMFWGAIFYRSQEPPSPFRGLPFLNKSSSSITLFNFCIIVKVGDMKEMGPFIIVCKLYMLVPIPSVEIK